uniref:ATP synthase F0 subunit 8 n=1 Tax=Haania sp. JZ-2017 TaxID=2073092 RepID=A0A343UN25_9NEOP|nr:ATP synthase F0 subunit 8 [Haania sp. JZ-2017]
MPQMMPLNWMSMFILFTLLIMMFNMLNYFVLINKMKKKMLIKTNNNTMIWKW